MNPTYGGLFIFGTACKVAHDPVPVVIQEDSFFGINGVVSLYGGSRGRTFVVSGVLVDEDPSSVSFDEQTLLNFADGIARDFTDTTGVLWPNVLITGPYRRHPDGIRPTIGGYCLPYQIVLRGLS